MPPSIRPNVCRALYRLCQPAAPSTRARLGWFGVTSPSLLLLGKTRVKREDLERQGGRGSNSAVPRSDALYRLFTFRI